MTKFNHNEIEKLLNAMIIDIFVPVSHSEALAMCKDQWLNVWEYVE